MSITFFDDMEFPGTEGPFRKRFHAKKKSLRSTFRDAADYLFKFHAIEQMEERGFLTGDVGTIMLHGRIEGLSSRLGFFLCPGEIPKTKTFQKKFLRLQDKVVITEGNQRIVVTVINNWTRWENLIYRAFPLASHSPRNQVGWKYLTKTKQVPFNFRIPYNYLYTYSFVQQKEELGVSVADIKNIMGHGRCFVTENYLYLYTVRMLPVKGDDLVCAVGTAVVVETNSRIAVAIVRAYGPSVDPILQLRKH